MRNTVIVLALAAAVGAGCDDHRRPELRRTLDSARVTLIESIGLAMNEAGEGAPIKAALLMGGEPVFSVGVHQESRGQDVRIALAGNVLSAAPTGPYRAPCAGSISLTESLAIAEATVGGEAVAVVPDDDVACAQEIQVLVGDVLWEVKVAGNGAVLETELSDEYGGSED